MTYRHRLGDRKNLRFLTKTGDRSYLYTNVWQTKVIFSQTARFAKMGKLGNRSHILDAFEQLH